MAPQRSWENPGIWFLWHQSHSGAGKLGTLRIPAHNFSCFFVDMPENLSPYILALKETIQLLLGFLLPVSGVRESGWASVAGITEQLPLGPALRCGQGDHGPVRAMSPLLGNP